MRKTEKIKKIKAIGTGYDESHPAFATAVFTRCTGGNPKLYGSHLADHANTIVLTLYSSMRNHHLNTDWYLTRKKIMEVEFSSAQFAELMTTMNVSSGTPCTLRNLDGEIIPGLPQNIVTESERVEDSFKENLREHVASMEQVEAQVAEILQKKNIGKADRSTIQRLVNTAKRFLSDAAPFAVQCFSEAKVKVVSSAKAEIDAFMTHAIQSAGIKALKEKEAIAEEPETLLLEE